MDRLQQKHSLFIKLGALFGPLLRLVDKPGEYDEQEKAETLAQYFAENQKLIREFFAFSIGQPGHNYALEYKRFSEALYGIKNMLAMSKSLAATIHKEFGEAKAAIDAVPVPRTSIILEAGSPFTAYCKLKELCEVDATNSLVWLDPFLGANIFHRFISSVRPVVPVTLVTSEPRPQAGTRDRKRWDGFIDVSRLYAQERGPDFYRLIVQPNLHDRWAVFDEKRIYSLGGSAKDAGDKDYFTITSVEASSENLEKIQKQVDSGTEYFGPNIAQHR